MVPILICDVFYHSIVKPHESQLGPYVIDRYCLGGIFFGIYGPDGSLVVSRAQRGYYDPEGT